MPDEVNKQDMTREVVRGVQITQSMNVTMREFNEVMGRINGLVGTCRARSMDQQHNPAEQLRLMRAANDALGEMRRRLSNFNATLGAVADQLEKELT